MPPIQYVLEEDAHRLHKALVDLGFTIKGQAGDLLRGLAALSGVGVETIRSFVSNGEKLTQRTYQAIESALPFLHQAIRIQQRLRDLPSTVQLAQLAKEADMPEEGLRGFREKLKLMPSRDQLEKLELSLNYNTELEKAPQLIANNQEGDEVIVATSIIATEEEVTIADSVSVEDDSVEPKLVNISPEAMKAAMLDSFQADSPEDFDRQIHERALAYQEQMNAADATDPELLREWAKEMVERSAEDLGLGAYQATGQTPAEELFTSTNQSTTDDDKEGDNMTGAGGVGQEATEQQDAESSRQELRETIEYLLGGSGLRLDIQHSYQPPFPGRSAEDKLSTLLNLANELLLGKEPFEIDVKTQRGSRMIKISMSARPDLPIS